MEKISELVRAHADMDEQLNHTAYVAHDKNVTPEKLKQIINEIEQISQNLSSWASTAAEIDQKCQQNGIIMRDASGSDTSAEKLITGLVHKISQINVELGKAQSELKAFEKQRANFEGMEAEVTNMLKNANAELQRAVLSLSSPDEVSGTVNHVDAILQQSHAISGAKEKLNAEASVLLDRDPSNISSIQNVLMAVNASYDGFEENVKNKLKKLNEMNAAWQAINHSRKLLNGVLSDVRSSADDKIPVLDINTAKQDLSTSRKALDSAKSAKAHLDNIAAKCHTINRLADDFPNFNKQEANALLDSLEKQWKNVTQSSEKAVQDLEAQNILWDQIEAAKLDLFTWLRETGHGLQNCQSDPELAQIKSAKYKDDLSTYWNMKMSIQAKANQLIQNNPKKSPENLKALIQLLDDEFVALKEVADGLDDLATAFSEQEQAVRSEIKKASDLISGIRESVVSCDNLTGDNKIILERLNQVHQHQDDLQGFSKILEKVNQKLYDMKSNYPSFGESTLIKEVASLDKRYQAVVAHGEKVEKNLLAFLRKVYDEKFNSFQRLVTSLNEKIDWCLPEPNSDYYNLGMKISSLSEIETGIRDCEKRKPELDADFAILSQVEDEEKINELSFQKEKLMNDVDGLSKRCTEIGESLKKASKLWQDYEKVSEQVLAWLKDGEARIRSESCGQIDLATAESKQNEMTAFVENFAQHETELTKLSQLSAEFLKECPESRAGQQSAQLKTRYHAVVKFCNGQLDRFASLQKSRELYNASVKDAHQWLEDSQAKLEAIKSGLQSSSKNFNAFQKHVSDLKEWEKNRDVGMGLLNTAVEKGEALFPGIVPENRETIRNELRALRNASEALLDSANSINKKIESIIIQRSSFDDNYSQVENWLHDAQAKLGDYKLKATLQEKKQSLQAYRVLNQDIASHKVIINQLHEKMVPLSDEEASAKITQMLNEYESLLKNVESRTQMAEGHVADHERFLQSVEKAHDWLEMLRTEVAPILSMVGVEKDGAELKLDLIENVLRQKQEGDQQLTACKACLEPALQGTDAPGQPILAREFEALQTGWEDFFVKCTEKLNSLRSVCCRFTELAAKVEDLENWIKQQEMQIRDQSLKNTAKSKREHLEKLKHFENELAARSDQFTQVIDESHEVERDSKLGVAIAKLLPRYQALKTTARENVSRYDTFVKEHTQFDENYGELEQWIQQLDEELKQHCAIVGDLKVLQERQKFVRELGDKYAKESTRFESVLTAGERLYVHTSPDGREVVRGQLRSLRSRWDTLGEAIQAALHQLDSCLLQFAEFTLQQEQLTAWLRDVERAMQRHTELRSGLPEKRAQLQNHRIMHQEITSHQSLVESVCDKAQNLVEQTKDDSLNIYLASIKQLFRDIVMKSQELLDSLQKNVELETQHGAHCSNLVDWISQNALQLTELSGVNGEKADIERRLAGVRSLRGKLPEGQALLSTAQESCIQVVKTTAPKGVESIEKNLTELTENLSSYERDIGGVEKKLENILDDWKNFETTLDAQTKWFRATEAVFREQKLLGSLEEKQQQLVNFLEKRDIITKQEVVIDSFVDKSHALLNATGAERINPLISQISNRYQLLHVLSKEVINRLQGLVDDHKGFEERLAETENWLVPLEKELTALKDVEDIVSKTAKIQALLGGRDEGAHKLTTLTVMAEKLYPDTSAPGREHIRNALRQLRDR